MTFKNMRRLKAYLTGKAMNFRQVIPLHMESNEKDVRVPVLTQTRTAEAIRVPLGAIFRVCMMVGVHVHGSNQIGRLVYANTRHDHMHDMVCVLNQCAWDNIYKTHIGNAFVLTLGAIINSTYV